MTPTAHPPPRDHLEIGLALARIEGMLAAQLPAIQDAVSATDIALRAHVADADARRDSLHSRINALNSKVDRHDVRIEDVEDRQAGQLGRVAQIVAVLGGVAGLLAVVLFGIAPT